MRIIVLTWFLVACGPARMPSAPTSYPGTLRAVGSIPTDFFARQFVHGAYGPRKIAFEAVLQKRGDRLVLMALTPYGAPALTLEQTGSEVKVTSRLEEPLPFEPRYVMLDIHRALFLGLESDAREGTVCAHVQDEDVCETRQAGAIIRRTFAREGYQGRIVVDYQAGYRPFTPPPKLTLHNPWFGYALTIETLETRPL